MAERRRKTSVRKTRKAPSLLPRLHKRAAKSLPDVTRDLVKLAGERKGEGMSGELRDVVYVLKTQKLRSARNAHAFRVGGGVAALLKLLVGADEEGRVLLLGAVGNLCALDEGTRGEVMANSLTEIVEIVKTSSSANVFNTSVRVIANLALDSQHIAAIREEGLIRELARILALQDIDSGCQQSVLRAMRLLCRENECRDEFKTHDVLSLVVKCFDSEDEGVVLSSLRLVEVLTQDGDPDIVQPLCSTSSSTTTCGYTGNASNSLQSVLRSCSHSNPKVSQSAITVLLHCAKNIDGRLGLASAGGVKTLVQYLDQCEQSGTIFREVINAVCACCRDVLSRQRLRDCGGLEKMIGMLSNSELSCVHGDIMSGLICYYFDESTLNVMVKKLGLLKALNYHLREMAQRHEHKVKERFEETSDSVYCEEESAPSSEDGEEEEEEEGSVGDSFSAVDSDVGSVMSGVATESSSSVVAEDDESLLESSVGSTGGKPEEEVGSASPSTNLGLNLGGNVEEGTLSLPLPLPLPLPCEGESPALCVNKSTLSSLPSVMSSPPSLTQQLSISVDSFLNFAALDEQQQQQRQVTTPTSRRPTLQLDFESSTPMPPNFIDSLLSSPNPYQKEHQACPPYSSRFGVTLDNQVVLLLSRVSHLRNCLVSLSSPDILLAILRYYFSCPSPNTHVFKVLSRIFKNPHCFQNCLAVLLPSIIYQHLSVPDSDSLDDSNLHGRFRHAERCSSLPPTLCSPISSHPSTSLFRTSSFQFTSVTESRSLCHTPDTSGPLQSPSTSLPDSQIPFPGDDHDSIPSPPDVSSPPLPPPPVHCPSWQAFHSTGQEMIEKLSKVAESPYGQGVLAHMLLRGEERERQACCLALPLLCRSPRVYQKLMLTYKGLELLIAMSVKEEREGQGEDDNLKPMAINSLLALAQNIVKLTDRRKRKLSNAPPSLCLPRAKRPCHDFSLGRLDSVQSFDPTLCEACDTRGQPPVPSPSGTCRYRDSDHYPFDLIVCVGGSGSGSTLRLPVHRSILSAISEVFSAMLEGDYCESTRGEVSIRGVTPLAFKSVVHYSYGCGWLCRCVLEEVRGSGGDEIPSLEDETCGADGGTGDESMALDNLIFTATVALINDITSSFKCVEDKQDVRHCLHVLSSANQFLILDLCAKCEHVACDYLTVDNAVAMFHYSQLHKHQWLSLRCVLFIVNLAHSDLRRELFQALISSPEGASAVELLHTFLEARLRG